MAFTGNILFWHCQHHCKQSSMFMHTRLLDYIQHCGSLLYGTTVSLHTPMPGLVVTQSFQEYCADCYCPCCTALLQLIKGNTFAGTAFFSYGAFWMAFFVVKYITATAKAAALASNTLPAFVGTFAVGQTLIHCLWGVFTFGFFIPTLRKNGCLMTVFGTLFVTFFLLAGGVWSKPCSQAAGYVGFMCGCSAIYTAFAEIYHESLGIMLPGLRPVRFI
eukprot:GHUV01005846.1.p1 GENE.GHUV01005846.1~~GHUV01005846.1.p1  ORF type:complete len:218 (+),score=40.35 GHUV01005846.1:137-790(+)